MRSAADESSVSGSVPFFGYYRFEVGRACTLPAERTLPAGPRERIKAERQCPAQSQNITSNTFTWDVQTFNTTNDAGSTAPNFLEGSSL